MPLELLKAHGQPVPVGLALRIPGRPDLLAVHVLDAQLEDRPVVQLEQSLGDVDPVVRVDADQVPGKLPAWEKDLRPPTAKAGDGE